MQSQSRFCSYQYDALDRLAARSSGQSTMRRFYCADRLSTESEEDHHRSCLQAGGRLLAWRDRTADSGWNTLLATDEANSVLAAGFNPLTTITYSPYGHRESAALPPGVPGFNGEQPDPLTGHYLLGNGYRAFNPVLMRFNGPDSLSPFGKGGVNAYSYCAGDPMNRLDPTGHFFKSFLRLLKNILPGRDRQIFRVIAPGVIGFEKAYGKRKTFIVVGHGEQSEINGFHPLTTSDDRLLDARGLAGMLKNSGVDLKKYDRISIKACYSADGSNPLASQFANITNKQVKGYRSTVSVTAPDAESSYVRRLSKGLYEYDGQIITIKPGLPDWIGDRIGMSYNPVLFNP